MKTEEKRESILSPLPFIIGIPITIVCAIVFRGYVPNSMFLGDERHYWYLVLLILPLHPPGYLLWLIIIYPFVRLYEII